jgi:lipopolysaccharide exporter
VARFRSINLKGDLFATVFCFAGQALIKLASSLVLTRILRPEAYGIITILMSIVFVVEMLSDIGVTVSLVRHRQGEEPSYLNTAWTLRLSRAALNSAVLFLSAPAIAALYHAPALTAPLRVCSIWFVLNGLESMSFAVAIRRHNSRVIMYSELLATSLSTGFSLTYCYFSRDFWGLVYGTLLNRALIVLMSHQFYRDVKPRLQIDRAAARELFKYTRFSIPSSILTLGLSQFDKVLFLRLFDLQLLGIYGLAGNIAGPIESLISKISQLVLYPRCASNYRADLDTFSRKYYTENTKLFLSMLIVPAAVGGASHLIISVLYDPRYAQSALVLQAFMLRAVLLALASSAEDLLIAAGQSHIILVGNVYRAATLVVLSLSGYALYGFTGFAYGTALSGLPPLLYYLWLQRAKGFLVARYEIYKVAFASGIALSSYLASEVLLTMWPAVLVKI